VLVWFHGGGFEHGSAATLRTDGSTYAREHGVIVVSATQRLGALGYTYVAGIDPSFAGDANGGIQDMVLALRWVRDEISAFGGDPGNVTVAGESGGGLKVAVLMATPAAQGLYHKAILQSGSPGPTVMLSPEHGTATARALLAELGIDPVAPLGPALGRLDPIAVVEAQERVTHRDTYAQEATQPRGFGFSPVLDGVVVTGAPLDAVTTGAGAQVPLIIGFTAHEWGAMMSHEASKDFDIDALTGQMRGLVGDRAAEVVAVYRQQFPELTPGQLWVRVTSHQWLALPSGRIAELRAARAAAPTWEYLFSWSSPDYPSLGSFHGIEGGFLFGTVEDVPITRSDPAAPRLARTANAAFARFVASGDPNGADLPTWPASTGSDHETLVLDHPVRVEHDPLAAIRAAWRTQTG